MIHRQKLSRYPLLEWLVERWRSFKDFAYISVIIINIMLLFYEVDSEGNYVYGGSNPNDVEGLCNAFSVV